MRDWVAIWSLSAPWLLHGSELSQRCMDERHEVIATAMTSVVQNVQPTGCPTLGEPPSRVQWCADAEAAVDQYTGDTY
jgi:hypothetical protein